MLTAALTGAFLALEAVVKAERPTRRALLALYGVSRAGQRLAAPQTAMLRRVLEEALDIPEGERALTDRDPYHSRPLPD